jgi:hypothetical protein
MPFFILRWAQMFKIEVKTVKRTGGLWTITMEHGWVHVRRWRAGSVLLSDVWFWSLVEPMLLRVFLYAEAHTLTLNNFYAGTSTQSDHQIPDYLKLMMLYCNLKLLIINQNKVIGQGTPSDTDNTEIFSHFSQTCHNGTCNIAIRLHTFFTLAFCRSD